MPDFSPGQPRNSSTAGNRSAPASAGRPIQRYDLDGNFVGDVSLVGLLSVSGSTLTVEFGAAGLSGNRTGAAGDGYSRLEFDLDGSDTFESARSFHRLPDDVDSDGAVTDGDRDLVRGHFSGGAAVRPGVRPGRGDGVVNGFDLSLVVRQRGRRLADGLFRDD